MKPKIQINTWKDEAKRLDVWTFESNVNLPVFTTHCLGLRFDLFSRHIAFELLWITDN